MAGQQDENERGGTDDVDEFADVDFSPMSDEELTYLAAKLFQMYDDEEAEREGRGYDDTDATEPVGE